MKLTTSALALVLACVASGLQAGPSIESYRFVNRCDIPLSENDRWSVLNTHGDKACQAFVAVQEDPQDAYVAQGQCECTYRDVDPRLLSRLKFAEANGRQTFVDANKLGDVCELSTDVGLYSTDNWNSEVSVTRSTIRVSLVCLDATPAPR